MASRRRSSLMLSLMAIVSGRIVGASHISAPISAAVVPRGGSGDDASVYSRGLALSEIATARSDRKRRRRFLFFGPYTTPSYRETLQEQVLLLEQQLRRAHDRVESLRTQYQQHKKKSKIYSLGLKTREPKIPQVDLQPLLDEIDELQEQVRLLENTRDELLILLEESQTQVDGLRSELEESRARTSAIRDEYERKLLELKSSLETSESDAAAAVDREKRKMRKLVKALAIREKKLLAKADRKQKKKQTQRQQTPSNFVQSSSYPPPNQPITASTVRGSPK